MLAIFHDSDYLVPFESYLESMDSLIGNEKMLVCIEDQIYSYKNGLKILLSQVVYGEMLPFEKLPDSLNLFAKEEIPVDEEQLDNLLLEEGPDVNNFE